MIPFPSSIPGIHSTGRALFFTSFACFYPLFPFMTPRIEGNHLAHPRLVDIFVCWAAVLLTHKNVCIPVSATALGSSLGTGGMETKLMAAGVATGAGVDTIIEYRATVSIPCVDHSTITHPKHTLFKTLNPTRDVKSWTSFRQVLSSSIWAFTWVFSRKKSGGRLLPVGVISVQGSFTSHQAVGICIRAKTSSVGVTGMAQSKEDPKAAVPGEYVRGISTSASSASVTLTAGSKTASSSYLMSLTTGGAHNFFYPS